MMPAGGGDVNTTLPLVLGIISMVLCGNFLLGIPAIIFAVIAMNSRSVGNLEDARQKAKIATILASIGMAMTVLVIMAWGAILAVAAMAQH
jgi:hypothetical protein